MRQSGHTFAPGDKLISVEDLVDDLHIFYTSSFCKEAKPLTGHATRKLL
jgi:hypothetical protein